MHQEIFKINYEHAPGIYLDGLQPYEPDEAQAGDSRYRAATLCYLLISSYTQEGKLGKQLHNRYRAACMPLSTDTLSETDFATERTALELTAVTLHLLYIKFLGRSSLWTNRGSTIHQ